MIGGRNEDDLTCCALHVTPIRKASGNVRALNRSRLAGYSAAVKFHKPTRVQALKKIKINFF